MGKLLVLKIFSPYYLYILKEFKRRKTKEKELITQTKDSQRDRESLRVYTFIITNKDYVCCTFIRNYKFFWFGDIVKELTLINLLVKTRDKK